MMTRPGRRLAQRLLRYLPEAWFERLRKAPSGSLRGRIGRLGMSDRVVRVSHGPAAGLRVYADRACVQYIDGDVELPVQLGVAEHLAPGNVFFDIGANVGFFTLIGGAAVGSEGQVAAFEPEPGNAAAIRRNLALNGFSNSQVFEAAVAAKNGRERLWTTAHPGGHTLESAGRPEDQCSSLEVDVVAIDPLVASGRLRPPDLVKIDVEGAELAVLEGMRQTLERARPTIICELDDETPAELEKKCRRVEEFLAAYDYRVSRMPPSYGLANWQVAHLLARPAAAG